MQTKRHDFPNKKFANEVHTHNLEDLVKYAGLKTSLDAETKGNPTFALNWNIVKDWSEITRYDLQIGWPHADDLYYACTSRPHGVLLWIKRYW